MRHATHACIKVSGAEGQGSAEGKLKNGRSTRWPGRTEGQQVKKRQAGPPRDRYHDACPSRAVNTRSLVRLGGLAGRPEEKLRRLVKWCGPGKRQPAALAKLGAWCAGAGPGPPAAGGGALHGAGHALGGGGAAVGLQRAAVVELQPAHLGRGGGLALAPQRSGRVQRAVCRGVVGRGGVAGLAMDCTLRLYERKSVGSCCRVPPWRVQRQSWGSSVAGAVQARRVPHGWAGAGRVGHPGCPGCPG